MSHKACSVMTTRTKAPGLALCAKAQAVMMTMVTACSWLCLSQVAEASPGIGMLIPNWFAAGFIALVFVLPILTLVTLIVQGMRKTSPNGLKMWNICATIVNLCVALGALSEIRLVGIFFLVPGLVGVLALPLLLLYKDLVPSREFSIRFAKIAGVVVLLGCVSTAGYLYLRKVIQQKRFAAIKKHEALREAKLIKVKLAGADFHLAKLAGAVFRDVSFAHVHFRRARMEGGQYHNIKSLRGAFFSPELLPFLRKVQAIGFDPAKALCLSADQKNYARNFAHKCYQWHARRSTKRRPPHCPAALKGPIIGYEKRTLKVEGVCPFHVSSQSGGPSTQAAACSVTLAQKRSYLQSIKAARQPSKEKIVTSLLTIGAGPGVVKSANPTAGPQTLAWKKIDGAWHVLMSTWTNFTGYPSPGKPYTPPKVRHLGHCCATVSQALSQDYGLFTLPQLAAEAAFGSITHKEKEPHRDLLGQTSRFVPPLPRRSYRRPRVWSGLSQGDVTCLHHLVCPTSCLGLPHKKTDARGSLDTAWLYI